MNEYSFPRRRMSNIENLRQIVEKNKKQKKWERERRSKIREILQFQREYDSKINQAAAYIQKHIKGFLARRRYRDSIYRNKLKASIVQLESTVHHCLLTLSDVTLASVGTVQKVFRRFMDAQTFKRNKKNTFAVLRIQSVFRAFIGRKLGIIKKTTIRIFSLVTKQNLSVCWDMWKFAKKENRLVNITVNPLWSQKNLAPIDSPRKEEIAPLYKKSVRKREAKKRIQIHKRLTQAFIARTDKTEDIEKTIKNPMKVRGKNYQRSTLSRDLYVKENWERKMRLNSTVSVQLRRKTKEPIGEFNFPPLLPIETPFAKEKELSDHDSEDFLLDDSIPMPPSHGLMFKQSLPELYSFLEIYGSNIRL